MSSSPAPSGVSSSMGRRAFLGRSAMVGVAAWAVPSVVSMDPVAAAVGSCVTGMTVYEFTSGLEGWTIQNNDGPGSHGHWKHNSEGSRDGGSLHYGRGTGGNYRTGNSRHSGRVYSPQIEIPSSATNTAKFTVWREVEPRSGYDVLRLRIIGSSTQILYEVYSGTNTSGFEAQTITIPSSFNGQTVRFQFDFDTVDKSFNDYEGVYVGRFEVTGCPPAGA